MWPLRASRQPIVRWLAARNARARAVTLRDPEGSREQSVEWMVTQYEEWEEIKLHGRLVALD